MRKYVSGPTCLQVSCSTGSGANSARQQYTNVSSHLASPPLQEVKEAFMTKNTHKAKIIKDNPAKDKDNQMSHFFLATDFHFHPHHTLSKSFCKQSTLTESQEQNRPCSRFLDRQPPTTQADSKCFAFSVHFSLKRFGDRL